MPSKEKLMLDYLVLLRDNVVLQRSRDPKIVYIAQSYWFSFRLQAENYNRVLQVPEVFMDENLHINYRWWKSNYELNVEITEKDSYYWFTNEKTGLVWEKHYEPLFPPYGIPTDIYNKVLLFSEEA